MKFPIRRICIIFMSFVILSCLPMKVAGLAYPAGYILPLKIVELIQTWQLGQLLSGGPIQFQLENSSGHFVIVSGAIDENPREYFVLDTGMQFTSVIPVYSKSLRVLPLTKLEISRMASKRKYKCGLLGQLSIGPIAVKLPFVAACPNPISPAISQYKISGIVGSNLLANSEICIDYEKNKVSIGAADRDRSRNWMPFKSSSSFLPCIGSDIIVRGKLDGKDVNYLLATGRCESMIPPSVTAELPSSDHCIWSVFWERYPDCHYGIYNAGNVEIGNFNVGNQKFMTVLPDRDWSKVDRNDKTIVLGARFFGKVKRLSIDYPNKRILVE